MLRSGKEPLKQEGYIFVYNKPPPNNWISKFGFMKTNFCHRLKAEGVLIN